jgi:hypothetical protein
MSFLIFKNGGILIA